jgi:TonB family protein
MAKNNSYHLNSKQLENYLSGKCDAPAMHHIEKHLLSCAFCASALEGLKAMPQQQIPPIVKHDLRKSLQERVKPNSRKSAIFLWQNMGIAASIVVVMLLGFWFLKQQETQIALNVENTSQLSPKNEQSAAIATVKPTETNPPSKATAMPENSSEKTNSSTKRIGSANSDKETDLIAAKSATKEAIAIPSEEVAKLPADKDGNKKEEIAQKPAAPTNPPPSTTSEVAFTPPVVVAAPAKALKTSKESMVYDDNKAKFLAISGKVNDESGAGLPGVNVHIKGQNIGTQTDVGGNFFLNNVKKGDVLNLNFVGMQPQEVVVQANQTAMNVVLKDDNKALSEVVVVGYEKTSETSSQANEVEPSMGWRVFKQYIKENLKYPAAAQINKIKGRVVARVSILPTGSIENIELVKKIGYGCDEEAIRLLRSIAWKSNKNSTSSVRVSIRFGK